MATRNIDEFLRKEWRNTVNPDLQKERDTRTFNTDELTYILDGGKEKTRRRREIEKLLFAEPLFHCDSLAKFSKSELYENAIHRTLRINELKKANNWTQEDYDIAVRCLNYEVGFVIHLSMFIPALERLATDEQKAKWLPLAESYRILGTYAQTELGHGTNLMALETTATFDPRTDEFVLRTPQLSSMKWWPGSLGKTATHAIVLAQLIIGNKNYGMNPFMVQLRSLEDHMPLPGITVGDIGAKLGANSNDNGFLILNDVRIPRENMLARNSKVTKDGRFIQTSTNKANYATMVLVRLNIIKWAQDTMKNGSLIAIRYSAVRRQSSLQAGGPEMQVLDYQTQQYKIFPGLAVSYALFFTHEAMMKEYEIAYAQIMRGNNQLLGQIHGQLSGLKALVSDLVTYELEMCRRSCGGHGYLKASVIGETLLHALPLVTVEGENTVMYLQCARYLMKQIAKALAGQDVDEPASYLKQDIHLYTCPVQKGEHCTNPISLMKIYTHRAHSAIASVARQLQFDLESGKDQSSAFNNNLVSLVQAAKAHCQLCMIKHFVEGVSALERTCSENLVSVLTQLCLYFGLHGIVTSSGEFLESEAIGLQQLEWIKAEELKSLAAIRPNAVALVDAFDMHDQTVMSALGRYDGNAYQHLFEAAKREPMNQTEVLPAYYKYLRDLIKGQPQAKL
ncbi:hypothetical protein ACJMK2_016159 [Sinanodonta woodiana]|uniref:Acyl-coenzyme A oxidase n=1 Tax=Sinanodonta woodiana TaxID=1069815 RepID=A0ABD3UWE0_SINWO